MPATTDINTIQSNIRSYTKDMTQYSLFLGGLNVKNKALEQYSPLRTGYSRVFMVKMPTFMEKIVPNKTKNFRHMLEYGFVGVDGIGNTTMDFEQVTGGYAGKSFDVGTVSKDETSEITIKLYEFQGSPVREYVDTWITGVSDTFTGIGHYHGALDLDPTLEYNQANHTAEMIYVVTGPTGRETDIEYACLLANMMPKTARKDQFNYTAGEHQIVQTDVPFTCVKYESPQINDIGRALIAKYKILRDYLNFSSGYTQADVDALPVPNIADWATA